MSRSSLLVLPTLLLLLASSAVAAQQSSAPSQPPAPPSPPCQAEEFRQFDFWIGDWEVRDQSGTLQGHNTIEAIEAGCVLQERWRSAGGGGGTSLNGWSPGEKNWHQTWMDQSGQRLQLDGGLDDDGRMVLRGEAISARSGATILNEISWTPLEDGRVRQHWRISRDGGETWQDAFLGFYARVEG